jgi:hypothetical protein
LLIEWTPSRPDVVSNRTTEPSNHQTGPSHQTGPNSWKENDPPAGPAPDYGRFADNCKATASGYMYGFDECFERRQKMSDDTIRF